MTGETIIFATFLAPVQYKTFLYIAEYVERYAGIPSMLLNGLALDDFASADADAGFIDAISYIHLLNQQPCPVELVAISASRDANTQDVLPTFFDIVVHAESSLTSVNDLENCAWAEHITRPHVEDYLADQQNMPAVNFRETLAASSQAQALRFVLEGKVDATAIDSRMLDIALCNSPRMAAQLRVLGTYCHSNGPFVVVAAHLRSSLKQKIQEALLTMHQEPFFAQLLQESSIERFIPATNKHYGRMREQFEHSRSVRTYAYGQAESTMPAYIS